MSQINKVLTEISIIKIFLIFILALAAIFVLEDIFGTDISDDFIFIVLLIYILFKLRGCFNDFKIDAKNIFSKVKFKFILLIVVVNIFFSYGMLYGFYLLVAFVPGIESAVYLTYKSIISFDLIMTIFISPVIEELLFRGILLNKLKQYYSTPFAIIVTSILFAVLHDPGAIIAAFVFGICMAILYLKTNNILVPILAHFINNLISEFLYYFDANNLIFTDLWVILAFTILAIVSLYLLVISFKQEWKKLC